MRHILFVDDEPNILEGLQRMLFPLQREWKMSFAPGGVQALALMEKQHFDVIVSDMRMPGMDGAQLLAEVKKRYPDTVRFILTGQSDTETVYRSVGDAHQFLTKPCTPKQLKECVDKAFSLGNLLRSEALKAVVARTSALPPVPRIYEKLCQELQSPEGAVANVGRIIESDPAMVAKILQLTNSAFFGLRQHVSSATQAVSLLGLEIIRALVLMTGVFNSLRDLKLPAEFSLDLCWLHSMMVGVYAQSISRYEAANKDVISNSYTAGVLHDLGELVLASGYPREYSYTREYARVNNCSTIESEQMVMGCTHAEIGAYLLGIWGLPNEIVEGVAYHHRPEDFIGTGFSPLVAVHAAEVIVDRRNKCGEISETTNTEAFLERIGKKGALENWESLCGAINVGEEL